ncbi:salicylate hydroxylase [Palleronia aestuarii]|uniref:Salicylate hydroxylase n=1 Tax=Palleronia aestuarii TaxID=568105 RepID=A0A2W7Q9X9_9RHOB|nr:FAD-dependent monooxygenase [Palleronia aestuarii]PZX18539.1 salicylate hydroxylase [Palleronia aestuarii]
MTERIGILGGGIGGLACALALARRGIVAEVFERAPEIGDVGAGVQISPNGAAVLRALDLGPAFEAAGVESRAVVVRDGLVDRDLIRMPLSGGAFRMLHRADLIAILADAARAAGVEIRTNHAAREALADGRPCLRFEDGTEETFDMLVGADGIHSVLRPALGNREVAFFTGQVAWRALVPGDAPAEARVETGPGRHLVHYPVRPGVVNLVAVEERTDWAEEGWHIPGDPDALRAAFAGFARPVRALLDRVEGVHLWGLFRHPVAARWQDGASALLGDAAHPTLPFLAQGANLALEDAWCLAAALAAPDRMAGLARYEAARKPRVGRAIAAAEANARNYHLDGPRRRAAHMALRLAGRVAPGAMLRRYDWLYGCDVTQP